MPNQKEYKMAIKIAGEIEKSFYESTKMTQKELNALARQAAKTAASAELASGSSLRSFQRSLSDAEPVFKGIENTALASFKAITAAASVAGAGIVAGLGASVSVGSEFESAFAGVKKTVEASDTELALMRDEIREMAKEMPSTAAELSEIVESAGQLGIQKEKITEFAKTTADLDVATNLSSEEGASSFAKFANITGMSQDNFDNLGSSVVALGNNFATTEADIISMAMRLAGAGDQVGLSQAQIMGYAASLSSVGIEAEAGGSAFSKLLVNLQMATETGEKLGEYADVAGMTGAEFKKAFQEDASVAINAFLNGLNDTQRNGKSAIAILDDMGLKEVRLRDTLLRAANAGELFGNALDISNEAWEENTALANEAAQRYATFESQCDILGNKLSDIGISVYDDMKPALTQALGLANDFIDGIAGKEDVIGDVIESTTKNMPTMVRQVREAGEAVGDFAEPFLAVGGWLTNNPGLITGTIAGIGTALATYKVASGVTSLVSALGNLNPVSMGIMALGGAVAVITGIGTAIKKSAEDAKRANLDAHFGNISLSLKELQEVASYVVENESLDKIRESVAAMEELDGIGEQIDSATRALNKMDWKVSIGMELTADEQADYIGQIEAYVNATQEYVSQQHYAVTLSIETLLGDNADGSRLVDEMNMFYAGQSAELARIGKELNEAVTEAFNDGLLDPKEAEIIANLKKEMAEIQAEMAGSDFEAGLDLIKMKFGGGELDADSFQNLQAEIQAQVDQATEAYDQAYKDAMSALRRQSKAEGWSQEKFDESAAEINQGYLNQKAGLQEKAVQFQVDMILERYPELEKELGKIQEVASEQTLKEFQAATENGMYEQHIPNIAGYVDFGYQADMGIDHTTQDAVAELYKYLQPSIQQLEETKSQAMEMGAELPEGINEGLQDANALGAISGSTDAMWSLIGQETESPEYKEMLQAMVDSGAAIPEEFNNGIMQNLGSIEEAVTKMYITARKAVISQTVSDESGNILPAKGQKQSGARELISNLTEHGDGGIFSVPHIAWVAERGTEAIIPINGSRDSIDMWEKTGELLGIDGLTGGTEPVAAGIERAAYSESTEPQIIYSPTINLYGDSLRGDEVEEVMETEQEKFSRMLALHNRTQLRRGFH